MATAEEIAREEYEAWCKRGYEGKSVCQDALDLCERVARRAAVQAEDGYISQPVALDCQKWLTAAGYGQPGQPNTLWSMVKAAVGDVLRLQRSRDFMLERLTAIQQYQQELPEPHRTAICNILANGKPRP